MEEARARGYSEDLIREALANVQPLPRVIQNDRNVGLGRASNQGIEATTAPYVLLLNNDTVVSGRWRITPSATTASWPTAYAIRG